MKPKLEREILNLCTEVLDANKVPYKTNRTKGNHLQITFSVKGRQHHVVISGSADWRAALNNRSHIRKIIKGVP